MYVMMIIAYSKSLRGYETRSKAHWMAEDWEPVRVDTMQYSYTRSDNSIMNCTLTPVSWHAQYIIICEQKLICVLDFVVWLLFLAWIVAWIVAL